MRSACLPAGRETGRFSVAEILKPMGFRKFREAKFCLSPVARAVKKQKRMAKGRPLLLLPAAPSAIIN